MDFIFLQSIYSSTLHGSWYYTTMYRTNKTALLPRHNDDDPRRLGFTLGLIHKSPARRAGRVLPKPDVDARPVESMAALRQNPHRLPVLKLPKTDRADVDRRRRRRQRRPVKTDLRQRHDLCLGHAHLFRPRKLHFPTRRRRPRVMSVGADVVDVGYVDKVAA